MAEGEWFYVVHQWMQELGLKGTELTLYAILYGYSQKGDGCYYGTRATLAERCGVSSVRTVDAALDALQGRGLIQKRTAHFEGQPVVTYSVCAKSARGCAKSAQGGVQNLHGGCAEIAPKHNKEQNKSVKENTPFTPPTIQEVADYVRGRKFADPDGFADMFVTICANNGWRRAGGKGEAITNWKNYIVSSWERNNLNKTFPRAAKPGATVDSANLKNYLK